MLSQELRAKANLLRQIREFFDKRGVTEVETPLLCKNTITDPFINPIFLKYPEKSNDKYYLQTSPEFAMKSLLANGSGCIYQICKAFRGEEEGRLHRKEFTMLEWYRVGFDDKKLIKETDDLMQNVLNTKPAICISYKDLFLEYLSINPYQISIDELKGNIINRKIDINISEEILITYSLVDWLNLLFDIFIQPNLLGDTSWIVYDYPSFMAALAKKDLNSIGESVAKRFEVFYKGVELGNGYYELQDPKEQLSRFKEDNKIRELNNLPQMPIDYGLIESLERGLPNCAGIAMGVDRIFMLKQKKSTI